MSCKSAKDDEGTISGSKEEDEPRLNAVFKRPRVVLHRADMSEDYVDSEQQAPEDPHFKEEEHEAHITKFPLTGVMKGEEGDGDHRGGSQADGLLAPLSDCDDTTSHSPDTDDEEHSKDMSEDDLDPEQQAPEDRHIKEEEQPADISKFPPTGVMKSEEGDGDNCGGSQADSLLAPQSNCDNTMSHSPDNDDEEHSKDDMRCRNNDKRWQCSQCGKTFSSKWNLKVHMRSHEGEKPFSCSDCGKRFAEKGHLSRHGRTHSGEKPFCCSVCGVRLAQKINLTIHMRKHTGEKPFVCPFCGKRFSIKGHLKTHTRIHTGEKPFSCSVCNFSFSERSKLVKHTRTHTGEKGFTCSVCDKKFAQRCTLTIHARIHTGEKPFGCSVCDKRFSRKDQIKRHKCAGKNSSK
ncbi:zinc finger protein 572-like isoform X2 [Phyllopteryx taeniolatus]|uniref:zinc finger protein 572-like isoform X2 n=1 Tax=Phyllopteryx taeniolatus TaxID=161469 RepID=UPI002AD2A714|nr:zinc finger protein 572-like isoform X2 [Phyllopteryx taeniolatus]